MTYVGDLTSALLYFNEEILKSKKSQLDLTLLDFNRFSNQVKTDIFEMAKKVKDPNYETNNLAELTRMTNIVKRIFKARTYRLFFQDKDAFEEETLKALEPKRYEIMMKRREEDRLRAAREEIMRKERIKQAQEEALRKKQAGALGMQPQPGPFSPGLTPEVDEAQRMMEMKKAEEARRRKIREQIEKDLRPEDRKKPEDILYSDNPSAGSYSNVILYRQLADKALATNMDSMNPYVLNASRILPHNDEVDEDVLLLLGLPETHDSVRGTFRGDRYVKVKKGKRIEQFDDKSLDENTFDEWYYLFPESPSGDKVVKSYINGKVVDLKIKIS